MVSSDHIIESMERVLASSLFRKADRQSRFLRHVVSKHLAGDDNSLREMSIGLDVYERPSGYDPKSDPIVRVEAARLRARLREYYETEGAQDQLRIDIPKGSYVPSFVSREEAPPAVAPMPDPVPETVPPPSRSRRWMILAAAAAALVFIAVSILAWRRTSLRAAPIDSIAVFPFADLSEKKDLAFMADGLTEQLQDELTRIGELRVAGSTTARQAATNPDVRAAARQIGVDALLLGSIRSEANQVRVTVRLYEGATGSAIWSGSFDADRSGLFKLEDQISSAIAKKLAIQLAVRREGVDVRMAPRRAQAYEYVQQARQLSEKDSAGPLDEIYRLYQLAATADPLYSPAHAGIAENLIVTSNPDKARALREAKLAMELDPASPRAHAVLALYYRDVEMDWAKARATCADSLRRLPNATPVITICASVEGILMNSTKVVELTRRAVALDPLSPRIHGGLMYALYQAGQFPEALREADAAIQLGSQSNFLHRHRAFILGAMGRPTEGLKDIADTRARVGGGPPDWAMVEGYLLGQMNRPGDAKKIIRDYGPGAPALHLAVIYLGMNERSTALDYFEKALDQTPSDMAHATSQYYMRVLDGEPRFEAIKHKLRL